MKKETPRNNRAGVTLVELLMSIALFAIVMMGAMQFFDTFSKQAGTASSDIAQDMESLILERALRKAVVNLQPSFNLVNLSDNNAANFFDFLPDALCRVNCTRELTLSAEYPNNEFIFIEELSSRFPPQLYPPQLAYNVGTNNSTTSAATLTFVGANRSISSNAPGALEKLFDGRLSVSGDSENPYHILLFTSLSEMRNMPADDQEPPLKSAYLGRLDGTDYTLKAFNPEGMLKLTHPLDTTLNFANDASGSSGVNGLDRFFRTLPPIGGTNVMAKVHVVNIHRYRYVPETEGEESHILWETWNFQQDSENGGWVNEYGVRLGVNVKSVTFFRETISSPVVSIKIEE